MTVIGTPTFRAIVIQLQRIVGGVQDLAGATLQALVLQLIKTSRPQLADELQQPTALRPYLVSLLRDECTPAQLALRVAALDGVVIEAVVEACSLAQATGTLLLLGNARYRIGAVITDPRSSPWAGASTLAGVHHAAAAAGATLHVHVASPLLPRALVARSLAPGRTDGAANLVPLLFTAIAGRWRAAAPSAMVPTDAAICEAAASVKVLRTNLRPALHLLRCGQRREERWGYRGELVIQLGVMREHQLLLQALVGIAFFSGAGVATTRGMGTLRRVDGYVDAPTSSGQGELNRQTARG